jgi:hypothetical protein
MMAPKASARLPGHLDCAAEMKCCSTAMGRAGGRPGRSIGVSVSLGRGQRREEKASKDVVGICSFLFPVSFERPFVMCFCDAASSTHSEKEPLLSLGHLVSSRLSLSLSLRLKSWGEIQRVSEVVTVPTRQRALDDATSSV